MFGKLARGGVVMAILGWLPFGCIAALEYPELRDVRATQRAMAAGVPDGAPTIEPLPRCEGTVVIDGCDTGVAALRPDGLCLQDFVDTCARAPSNFTDCVAEIPIGSGPSDALLGCAAKAGRCRYELAASLPGEACGARPCAEGASFCGKSCVSDADCEDFTVGVDCDQGGSCVERWKTVRCAVACTTTCH